MTDSGPGPDDLDAPTEPGRPWWQTGAQGVPDLEALLGPEAMGAVGGVADEALKLFLVLRDRVADAAAAQPPASSSGDGVAHEAGGNWPVLLGQWAAGAARAVGEFAAAAQQGTGPAGGQGSASAAGGGGSGTTAPSAPGEAAACAYCPICQAIALFRSVPMSTWQRLASSIVEVADAAGEPGTGSSASTHVVAPTGQTETGSGPVASFLAQLRDPAPQDGPEPGTGQPEGPTPPR